MGIFTALIVGEAIACKFNKKIEETVAIAMMILTFCIYIPGLKFSLKYGVFLGIGLTAIALAYVVYKLVKCKLDVTRSLFSWGMFALIIYFCYAMVYAYHRGYDHPDDFYCWGLMVKSFCDSKDMFSEFSTAITAGHTPFLPLWDFYNAELSGGYSEFICYLSQNIFEMALLVPIFASIREKLSSKRFVITVVALPVIMLLSGMESFRTITMDPALGALIAFSVFNIVKLVETKDNYYLVSVILGMSSSCLVKRIGVLFASLILLILVFACFENKHRIYLGAIISTAILSAVTFTWFGWYIYVLMPIGFLFVGICLIAMHAIYKRINKGLRPWILAGLVLIFPVFIYVGALVFYRGDGYAMTVFARFFAEMISFDVSVGYLKLSYGCYILLLIIGIVVLHKSDEAGYMKYVMVAFAIAMVIYDFVMLYLHISTIGPSNRYKERLIERYMIPWEIAAVYLLLYAFIIYARKLTTVRLSIALLVIVLLSDVGTALYTVFNKREIPHYTALSDGGVKLKPGDMIYYLDEQSSYNYANREFYYYVYPAKTNFIYNVIGGEDLGRLELTAGEFEEKLLGEYDYLYLQTIDDDFADRFGSLFEKSDEIEPESAYYVTENGGNVTLKKVEK